MKVEAKDRAVEREVGSASAWLILTVTCLGIFVAALDQNAVNVSLTQITIDLGLPITKLGSAMWIITGFLIGYTIAMPLMGKVSDVYGHRRVYIACIVIFAVGSYFCGRASSLPVLIAARVVQAIGGGAIIPVAMGIVGFHFSLRQRALALGVIGAVAEAGSVLGPLYGGLITGRFGWRWIFYVNLPVSVIVIALVFVLLRGNPGHKMRIDYVGAALVGTSLAALTLGVSLLGGHDVSWIVPTGLLIGAVVLFALFAYVESRVSDPIIPLRLFRNRTFASANLINFFVGGALITAMVDVPVFTSTVRGGSPEQVGLSMLRLTAPMPIGALIGGVLAERAGYRTVTSVGLAFCAAGFFLMSRWTTTVSYLQMTPSLLAAGFGFGLVIAPIGASVLNSVGKWVKGLASALVTVMRMAGMMIGLSVMTAWGLSSFNATLSQISLHVQSGATQEEINREAEKYRVALESAGMNLFTSIFLVAAIVCLVAIVPALFLRTVSGEPETEGAELKQA